MSHPTALWEAAGAVRRGGGGGIGRVDRFVPYALPRRESVLVSHHTASVGHSHTAPKKPTIDHAPKHSTTSDAMSFGERTSADAARADTEWQRRKERHAEALEEALEWDAEHPADPDATGRAFDVFGCRMVKGSVLEGMEAEQKKGEEEEKDEAGDGEVDGSA